MLIVRSPVRISFGGGGTDLPTYYQQHGGAVLSTAINKYFYTILGRRSDRCIRLAGNLPRQCTAGHPDFQPKQRADGSSH